MDNPREEFDASSVIELLGGTNKTAELCEVTPGAVSQWRRKRIPKSQLKFIKAARPELFASQAEAPDEILTT